MTKLPESSFNLRNKKNLYPIIFIVLVAVFSAFGFNAKESKNLAEETIGVVESISDVGDNESLVGEYAIVKRVVDGDTIELENGQKVRYIGIDAPESVDPRRPVECFGKEASERNRELVEGKKVRLEKDISDTDKYGRLLRYVWIDDQIVNEILVREGFAQANTYPPDVKYQEKLIEAEEFATRENRGLWGEKCNK